jgi:hypothetical protein
MEFLCTKARPASGAYTDADGHSTPARCHEVLLVPTISQHDKPGGIADIKLTVWGHTCPYVEGQRYELSL